LAVFLARRRRRSSIIRPARIMAISMPLITMMELLCARNNWLYVFKLNIYSFRLTTLSPSVSRTELAGTFRIQNVNANGIKSRSAIHLPGTLVTLRGPSHPEGSTMTACTLSEAFSLSCVPRPSFMMPSNPLGVGLKFSSLSL